MVASFLLLVLGKLAEVVGQELRWVLLFETEHASAELDEVPASKCRGTRRLEEVRPLEIVADEVHDDQIGIEETGAVLIGRHLHGAVVARGGEVHM